MGGGKGGSTNTNTTSNTSTIIPDWLTDASQQAVGMAQNLANTPAGAPLSTDQLVAGQSPYTTQAYQQVADQQGSANPAFNAAAGAYGGLLGQAMPQTADQITSLANNLYGNYQQAALNPASNLLSNSAAMTNGLYNGAQFNSQNLYGGAMGQTAGLLGSYLNNAGPATAQQVGANTMSLMSPYASSVVAPALQAGQQQLALADQGIANNANQVGAFGGSRMGVEEGVAAAQTALGTQQYIGNMMNAGYNAALTPGYNLASQASTQGDNAANTLAGQGFTAAGNLASQGYNSAAAQAAQGYGTASLLGQAGIAGYNNAAGMGQGIANTNLSSGLTAAQQLPGQAVTCRLVWRNSRPARYRRPAPR